MTGHEGGDVDGHRTRLTRSTASMTGESGSLLGIGDFSRYAGLSVRMLRHYDERGLLAPAGVARSPGIAGTGRNSCRSPVASDRCAMPGAASR